MVCLSESYLFDIETGRGRVCEGGARVVRSHTPEDETAVANVAACG